MNTRRKLQLSAASVFASGLLTLATASPPAALAATCPGFVEYCSAYVNCPPISGCSVTQYWVTISPCPGPATWCIYE